MKRVVHYLEKVNKKIKKEIVDAIEPTVCRWEGFRSNDSRLFYSPICDSAIVDVIAITFKFCPYCGNKINFARRGDPQ